MSVLVACNTKNCTEELVKTCSIASSIPTWPSEPKIASPSSVTYLYGVAPYKQALVRNTEYKYSSLNPSSHRHDRGSGLQHLLRRVLCDSFFFAFGRIMEGPSEPIKSFTDYSVPIELNSFFSLDANPRGLTTTTHLRPRRSQLRSAMVPSCLIDVRRAVKTACAMITIICPSRLRVFTYLVVFDVLLYPTPRSKYGVGFCYLVQ
jgi:hypothetical protein